MGVKQRLDLELRSYAYEWVTPLPNSTGAPGGVGIGCIDNRIDDKGQWGELGLISVLDASSRIFDAQA